MADLLITDLDNTLYNWVDYFAPSFRGMLHALSKNLKINEDVLLEDFKQVYSKYGSLEFSFVIQELEICKNLSEDEIYKLIYLGKTVFDIVRSKNLQPYSGVKETLIWCQYNDIKVIGITNAPLFHAKMRLKELSLDSYFYGLAAWEGHHSENQKFATTINKKQLEGKYLTKIKKEWTLPTEFIKPSPFGYFQIVNDLKGIHNVYVVGDSLAKDLAPAQEIGAKTIWAKYGLIFEKKNLDTLIKITPWTSEGIKSAYNYEKIDPDYTINSFNEIISIIPTQQLNLF